MVPESLKLKNQLCFPLYACAKEVVRLYTPHLMPHGLTYTQYLVLLVLFEEQNLSVKQLGTQLFLDSGTLTPLLKRMEQEGWVSRLRDQSDERSVIVSLTDKGQDFQQIAETIPSKIAGCLPLSQEEAIQLYQLLYKTLSPLKNPDSL